jgi:hypothetical protein
VNLKIKRLPTPYAAPTKLKRFWSIIDSGAATKPLFWERLKTDDAVPRSGAVQSPRDPRDRTWLRRVW